MTRIAARKKSALGNKGPAQKARLAVFFLAFTIFIATGFVIVKRFHPFNWLLSQPIERWIFAKKEGVSEHITKVKQFASHRAHNVPEPIHFEFYTALPAMQIQEAKIINQVKPVMAAKQKTTPQSASFFNADEIANKFAQEQLKTKQYILQLGSFNNLASAEKYKKVLIKNGIETLVVKDVKGKRAIYRLEHGPFTNATRAKLAQKKLEQRGIKSIVRKLA